MLKFLRKKKTVKRIFWVAALLIIPGFITLQVGNLSKNGKLNNRVSVGDNIQISSEDFAKSLKDAEVGLFLNYFNQPEVLDKLKTDRELLSQIAYQNLILKNITKREKIAVSDREVIKFISAHPLFNRNGEFDNKLYEHILKYNLGLMPRYFEESARSFLANSKLKEDITKNVAVSEKELLGFYKNEYEKIRFSYILIDQNSLKDEILVSENEINSFYDRNKILFKGEEKEKVSSYIANLIKNEKSIELVDKKAAELYNESKVDDINLEELAKRHNLKLHNTEFISRYDNIDEIVETYKIVEMAFKLKPGQVSNPIEIKNGFAIIEPMEFKFINEGEFEKEKENYKNKALSIKKMGIFDNWLKSIAINYSFDADPEKL